jgi:betaine-aldehyde dehydrogenase
MSTTSTAAPVRFQTKLFINGEFVDAENGATAPSYNPHDNTVLAEVASASTADVDKAVKAAQEALPKWAGLAAADRGRLLMKLADRIEEKAEEIATIESLDTGHPMRDTSRLDVPRTAMTFRYFGGMADKYEGAVIPVDQGFLNYTLRQPVGVVGQIVPWNFPVMFTSWKMGPALAAGNTVVLKPAALTPLSALWVAEQMREVGIPKGVVNILPGAGRSVGQHIAEHPGIAKISFTGSTDVGRGIQVAAAKTLKRVGLELGGKGANIVFADANIPAAVGGSAFAIFHNQGQACIAGSRLILHESIAEEFLDKFIKLAQSIKIGNPLDMATEMGPLTSLGHRDKVLGYTQIAKDQGGKVLTGGEPPKNRADLAGGYYVQPTVVEAKYDARVSCEEVFGPFVVVTTFKTDEEALQIANSVEYGLGGGLWTSNLSRAHKFAQVIRSGMVWINCYKRVNPASPFGGVGSSGYGREMGFEAMHQYTEVKSVWVNVDANIPPFYPR